MRKVYAQLRPVWQKRRSPFWSLFAGSSALTALKQLKYKKVAETVGEMMQEVREGSIDAVKARDILKAGLGAGVDNYLSYHFLRVLKTAMPLKLTGDEVAGGRL